MIEGFVANLRGFICHAHKGNWAVLITFTDCQFEVYHYYFLLLKNELVWDVPRGFSFAVLNIHFISVKSGMQ